MARDDGEREKRLPEENYKYNIIRKLQERVDAGNDNHFPG